MKLIVIGAGQSAYDENVLDVISDASIEMIQIC